MLTNTNRFSFIRPEKCPVFYGYIIVASGTLGVIMSIPGQTIGVSAFTEPVQDALGLTRTTYSLAYMVGTLLSSFFLTKAGKLYDKHGARWVAFFATLGLSVSLLLCASSLAISKSIMHLLNVGDLIIPAIVIALFFFLIRFSGQGVLTMVSRNMIMKWFDTKRGRVNAISSAIASVTFSLSPRWTFRLVEQQGWRNAWIIMAVALIVLSLIILQFFRDKPEDHGLLLDGGKKIQNKQKGAEPQSAKKQYSLQDAKKTRAFWMYSIMLAFNGFFITGFTFQIVSIFESSGFQAQRGISVFLPVSLISLSVTIVGNMLADRIKLKMLLYAMIFGGVMASLGLVFLDRNFGYYLIIPGNGILGGIFAILISIAWPRFFGRKYLGEISGKAMSMIVAASAIAPYLFSLSFRFLRTYAGIGIISVLFLLIIATASLKANNPQEKSHPTSG